ncbi:unnamed protein product [Durusdinium trenchii]|uniref:Uncharacterized protein n=1 Tax=Durusdinium trenchii TaxID=1381693 RepID=A0ABP0SZD5_9DINO
MASCSGCFACFKFPRQRVEAKKTTVPAPKTQKLPLPLNVGFATLKLNQLESDDETLGPRLELRISATDDGYVTEEGLSAMLEFMDFVLDLPQVSCGEGFQLTFDQMLGTSYLEVIKRVICWSCEHGRTSKWVHRCKLWKIIVAASAYPQVSGFLLQGAFKFYPPPCTTYLLTDDDQNPNVKIFEPERETLKLARLEEDLQDEVAAHTDSEGHVHLQHQKGLRKARNWGDSLPSEINVGFALVSQGFDGVEGYLKIKGLDGDLSMEGLNEMMDFMDAFTLSDKAQQGFSIMYDVRSMRSPSMQMVTTVAEWGAAPVRQKRWERLNHSCKIIITAGLRFTLAKGVLTTFFLMCPPVTRTYLMWDPDQALDTAALFEP